MASTEILLLIVAAVATLYFWCKQNFGYWQRWSIPYVKPTPIIGNTKEVFSLKTSFGLHLSDIYRDSKFADASVVGIYIFHQPGLLIRDLELVKSVLIKDFNSFSNRFAACDPHRDALGSNNLFFVKNPAWKEIRTKLTPVFTSGKIKQMYPLMIEIAGEFEAHLACHLKSNNAFVADVKEVCALFTTDLIATVAFGIQANSLKNPNADFRKFAKTQFEFNIKRAVEFFVIFCLPKLVSLFRVRMFPKPYSKFLRDTISYTMSERERNGNTRNDLIDILVALKNEGAQEQEAKHFAKNSDFLVAQAALFLSAGFETSSSTMAFTLYELSKRPDLQKRLRAEIHEALLNENGRLSYEKINSLQYLGMVLDEILRMYPVLPFLDREYNHVTIESEISLKPHYDYTLPNGMPVFIPILGIQRDPKYWPNPNTFDPERFSSENKKFHHPMTYLPFGTGPHNCIGNRIGLLQAKIGLVHLLKNYYVAPCEKTVKEISFDPRSFLLQCVGDIHLKLVNDRFYDLESNK